MAVDALAEETIKAQILTASNTYNQLALVREFKKSVSSDLKSVNRNIGRLGYSLSKAFNIKQLGSKLSDVFNKGFKQISSPMKKLGNKIGSIFSGLNTKLSNFKPLESIREKFANITKKPVETVKSVLGRSDEQLRRKYYNLWWNPKKVAKIWAKEFNQNKNLTVASAKKSAGITEIGGALLGVVSKFFIMAKKFIASVLLQLVVALHTAIGPYVMLIVGTIVLLALLFKDELKTLIPMFGKILGVVANMLDQVKGPLGNLLVKIFGVMTDIASAISNVLGSVLNGISNLLDNLVGLVVNVLSTVNTVWGLLSDTVITLLTPIRNVVVALQPVFEGMVGLLKKFIDNPIGTAVDVGKSIVGGIKGVVGGLFGSTTKDEKEGGNILNNVFMKIGESLLALKDYVIGGGLKETISSFITKISKSKLVQGIEEFFTNALPEFFNVLFNKIDSIVMMIGSSFNMGNSFFSSASRMYESMAASANKYLNKFKGFLGFTVTEEDRRSEEGPRNPFEEFIRGFEQMRKDTIELLTAIKDSLLTIEKNKIEIGSITAKNTGEASDGKRTNALQNINVNYQVDITQVLSKMDETNKKLDSIVTNTTPEENVESGGSVWSLR